MNRIEKILMEYVAFAEMAEETRREVVRRLEEVKAEPKREEYDRRDEQRC